MTLIELMRSGKDIGANVEVTGIDIAHAFVWGEGDDVTEYGYEFYKELLESEVKESISDGPLWPTSLLEIQYNGDIGLARDFFASAAGYITVSEYKKLFTDGSAE